jgi:hypothetical protein
MAPGPPLPPLPGQPCAFEFFQVYQVAWSKYGVPVRLRVRGWGEERGGRRTGLNGVEARAKAVYRLARAPGTMEILYRPACASGGWGGEGGRRTGLNGVKARAKAVYRLARAREKMGGWNMSLRGTRAAFTVSTQFSRYEFHGT